MPEPLFTQPERRSYLLPLIAAIAALAVAIALAVHFFPATTVNIAQTHLAVVPTHTVFHNQTIVVGPDQSADVLYIAQTLRLDNELRVPIFIENFTLSVTTDQGDEVATAVRKDDLATVRTSFPVLEKLLTQPLLRETTIAPGKQAEGVVLFSLHQSRAQWEARKNAITQVDLYHQHPVYQTIPQTMSARP